MHSSAGIPRECAALLPSPGTAHSPNPAGKRAGSPPCHGRPLSVPRARAVQRSRNETPPSRDSGSGVLEGSQLSSTRASMASWHSRAHSWLHWECRRADCSRRAGMRALGMAPCGSSRLSLASALGAVWARRGAMEAGTPRAGGIPGSEPAWATGSCQEQPWARHSPHCQPGARGQRCPPLSLGDARASEGGAGAGRHIQGTRAPIPRHRNRAGAEVDGGNQAGPAPRGWRHPAAAGARDGLGSARAPVPECSGGAQLCSARRVTDGVLSPHYVCLSKFNGL